MGTISLFVAIYLATFVAIGFVGGITGIRSFYWPALVAATAATIATVGIMESGRWNIGFIAPPWLAARDAMLGLALAAILIGTADLLILVSTSVRQVRGNGFPWAELWIVFVPAAIHEEVVFRGYLFQKIRAWNRHAGVAASSIAFAALHAGNRGIEPIAIANVLLAGIFLALAWERYQRLWFPIGIHLGWNVFSGPILGYAISGFVPAASLLRIAGGGPPWLTGGGFGIEGSVVVTLVELGGIAFLQTQNAECKMRNAE